MTRSAVRVRPATGDDAAQLAALVEAADPISGTTGRARAEDRTDHLTRRFASILCDRSRDALVATDDAGGVVGLLATRLDEIGTVDFTPVLHVTHLLVHPKYRRRGVARALLAGAVELAEEAEIDTVLATAAAGSREGNRYLARIGFAPLVVHRVASTAVLRRTLGMTDAAGRVAALRRAARLSRARRAGLAPRAVSRGA